MSRITVTRLAELRVGDRLISQEGAPTVRRCVSPTSWDRSSSALP